MVPIGSLLDNQHDHTDVEASQKISGATSTEHNRQRTSGVRVKRTVELISGTRGFITRKLFARQLAYVAGGIVRVRGKILTVGSEYGRRSPEENGKEPL